MCLQPCISRHLIPELNGINTSDFKCGQSVRRLTTRTFQDVFQHQWADQERWVDGNGRPRWRRRRRIFVLQSDKYGLYSNWHIKWRHKRKYCLQRNSSEFQWAPPESRLPFTWTTSLYISGDQKKNKTHTHSELHRAPFGTSLAVMKWSGQETKRRRGRRAACNWWSHGKTIGPSVVTGVSCCLECADKCRHRC